MPQKKLSLETLGDLDHGAAGAIINREIAIAVDDTDDRGDDGLSRKVVILLTLKKQKNGLVHTKVETTAQVPKRATNETVSALRRQADGKSTILFQEDSPDNPEQETLPFDAASNN
jgi:hypothetical protein